ncbi:hypothetical protein QAD02_019223 [Eretmocerus hayati]|uniref:Uncharacterized protein n=1 Tax=Eretmocerus hayati TaxID=131215 RepID=A0ACC2PK68_9HYME|nr:hypothetical protein QAD02_019223 [Eretmocerus hayati]
MQAQNHQKSPKSQHKCSKLRCGCSEGDDLDKLRRELRSLRKKAEAVPRGARLQAADTLLQAASRPPNKDDEEAQAIHQANELSVRETSLELLKAQRDRVKELASTLRQFSESLAQHEEEMCRVDLEIADLQNHICSIKNKLNERKDRDDMIEKREKQIKLYEEAVWRETTVTEYQEQNKLQKNLKKLSSRLNSMKTDEELKNKQRQEQREIDTKLLLDAVMKIENFLKDTRFLMKKRK